MFIKNRRGRFSPAQQIVSKDLPTVSVVIPCYNYANFLPEAVLSVISQVGANTQVIIVDDASTDNSLSVAQSLAAEHAEVMVLSNASNRGPVHTFNHGLEHATGEYLVRLDADDLLTPGSLRRAIDVCQVHPEVGLVYGHPVHFSGSSRPAARQQVKGWALWSGMDWVEERCRAGVNVITSPEVLMRMSIVRQMGGQRDLPHGHDMEMWLRIASVSDVAFIRGADQAWHRDHAQSLSARKVNDAVDLAERAKVFETLFSWMTSPADRVAKMRSLTDKALFDGGLKSLRVQLQLGVPDVQGFTQMISVVQGLNLNENQRAMLASVQAAWQVPRNSMLKAIPVFFHRAGRRIIWEYRQRHWRSFGVY